MVITSIGKPSVTADKPIITIFHFSDGTAKVIFDKEAMLNKFQEKKSDLTKGSLNDNNFISSDITLELTPNPVLNHANISFTLENNADVKIYAYDNRLGRKLFFEGYLAKGTQKLLLDLSDLSSGLVIFQLEIAGSLHTVSKAIKL